MDWIDEVKAERRKGISRPLNQSSHAAVDARFPGLTREICISCDGETGRAGKGEDSLYDGDDGPYCNECYCCKHGFEP